MKKLKMNWNEIKGLNEQQAEDYMLNNWGQIPKQWNNPLFRQSITGVSADIEAHLNFGEQAYGGPDRLGEDARTTWWQRNITGQGHPAERIFLNSVQSKSGEKNNTSTPGVEFLTIKM